MEKENCLNEVMYKLSKKYEVIQGIALSVLIFLIPMIIPQLLSAIFGKTAWIATNSQYVVGTIVNIALVAAAINVKGIKQIAGLITLPSISAIGSGLIFKSAILAKAAIIYAGFRLLAAIINIPAPMFTALNLSMGMNQLVTATIASIIGFAFVAFRKESK